MIDTSNKYNCCGCSACVQVCPQKCISFNEDEQGFSYPLVRKEKCIDCGLCEKVCHELQAYEERKPLQVLAAINKDTDIRIQSSSGGIFTIIAEQVIQEGGVVFGARYDNDWQVTLDYTDTMDGLYAFRGSKYIQSKTGNVYIQAQQFLKEGRTVLFTGTPCHIAGLHHFLRKQYNNLITVDFICHGVPSAKVWVKYLNEVVGAGRKAVKDMKFRNKDKGWKKLNFKMAYDKDTKSVTLSSFHKQNHYMRAFLSDMILRPSCYECKAKLGRSHSDITIADFWGVNIAHPEMDDDKGTGLVLINTKKGKKILDLTKISYKEVNFTEAINCNPAWAKSAKAHPHREQFFQQLDLTSSVIDLIDKQLNPSVLSRICKFPFITKQKFGRTVHRLITLKDKRPNIKDCNDYAMDIPQSLQCDEIANVNFRNKSDGWSHYHLSIKLTSKPAKTS